MSGLLICIFALLLPITAAADLSDGLVAFYPFSSNTIDASGNGNDCQNFGATLTSDRFGQNNSAYYFDGSTYLQCAVPGGFPLGNAPRSISGWLYRESESIDQGILQYGTASNTRMCGLILSLNSPDRLYFYGHNQDHASNSVLPMNSWTHFVMTYNGTTVELFLNGNPDGSRSRSLGTVMSGEGFTIGVRPWAYYWTGKLDDIRVYNRVLTQQEIDQLYTMIPLPAPQLAISRDGADLVRLDWDALPGAASYNVYSADEPYPYRRSGLVKQLESARTSGNIRLAAAVSFSE